jgi:phenylalanine-4-hydroxylase
MEALSGVPPHLRKYVVTQDYAAYTVEDQAVWRFVLLQTYARHLRSAHPAYAAGFAAAGISVEEIPRITCMNEQLAACGFQAVCVDGFIPPRAFQSFQARGFLPVAADIRTSRHLTYTPAPDIIHEAAGHAPFLAHREYAHFLRRIGAVGEKAFANAHDREVYEAIFLLSELKEDPSASSVQISRAEACLAALTTQAHAPSEAALVARLYWWTVEYGLIGAPHDYRLYGAGLLSSIGEAHFCHDPHVPKLPLTAACIETSYDITQPQPQLFVARDFEHLNEVLDDVSRTLAFRVGGRAAVAQAHASGEVATFELGSGLQLVGVVSRLRESAGTLEAVEFTGPCAIAADGDIVADLPRTQGYLLPLGALADGKSLSELNAHALTRAGSEIRLALRSGIVVRGTLLRSVERAGRAAVLLFAECVIERGAEVLWHSRDPHPLVLAERVVSAHAAPPQDYYGATEFSGTRVPKPRALDADRRSMIALYEEALATLRQSFGSAVVPSFIAIHRELCDRYPDEWLLRWNLLESLLKLRAGSELQAQLARELEQLEIRYAHREPIATGLGYLRTLVSEDS